MTTTRSVALSVTLVVVAFLSTADPTVAQSQDDMLTHDTEPVVVHPEEAGGTVGYSAADFLGSVSPGTFDAFGVAFGIAEISQTGDVLTVRVAPCVQSWEIAAIVLEPPSLSTGRTAEVMVGDTPVQAGALRVAAASCDGEATRWAVPGVSVDTLEAGHGSIAVVFTVRSLTTTRTNIAEDSGFGGVLAQRRGLREMVCALPDNLLGVGACFPLMTFSASLAVIGGLFLVGGVRNPLILGGSGLVAMSGMAAIIAPAPILILGFAAAAVGVTSLLLLLRR